MLGTKIRNWMEAHIARSRAKRKETRAKPPTATATLVVGGGGLGLGDDVRYFDAKYLAGRDPKLDEILPTLPISPSSFKPYRGDEPRRRPHQRDGPTTAERQHLQRQQQHQHQHQQHHQYKGGDGGQVNAGAVNLSSPESAYSTGYSTDGTSPCATYAPEHYVSARTTTAAAAAAQRQQQQRRAPPVLPQPPPPLDAAVGGQRNRVRGRRPDAEWQRIEARGDDAGVRGLAGSTGTYSVSRGRYPADARGLGEEEEDQQQQQHPWRKPAPPTIGRPLTSSPRIHPGGEYGRRACPADSATTSINYPLQLFSPRRMAPLPAPQQPLVATAGTQVVPIMSPRQRSRVRTNPWHHQAARRQPLAAAMMPFGGPRPWSRQQQQQQQQQQQRRRQCYSINDYCCRQESLSVGRSPVNRSDWCFSAHQLRQQQQQQQHRQRFGSRTRSASSASSCSSRSRSCSLSSSSSNNSNSIPSSPSSDDVTLNEVMGKFDENYLYEKETDIVSDHNDVGGGGGGWASTDNVSSSVNFSSDASACSSFDGSCPSSRSASRQRPRSPTSGRRQRRRRHRRSGFELDDEEEGRGEVELLQEVMSRRFQQSSGGEATARANRALLERLLMKNKNPSLGGGGGGGGGPRRAWSANPAALRATGPASRSVGGTPICLRRVNAVGDGGGGGGPTSPSSRIGLERRNHHQVYPAESTSSLQSISASELALLEADKEADLKYAQLIMEAEQMLINAQQQLRCEESSCNSRCGSPASGPIDGSPSRFSRQFQQQQQQQQTCKGSAPNKRVELIKNAELNIELALSKSRNSQPELSSGSIKDLLDHSSPKRLLQQQQKKVINPVLTQTAFTTHTTGNLTDFRSIDVNPAAMLKNVGQVDELNPSSEYYSCPQSEPVKRKVYEAHRQENGRLLQRHQAPPWLRNSDGDCANDQQQHQQQHQQHQQSQLQSASAASSYSQLRKHMLIETLQGLKQSLEDQSAALKMSCLRPL